MNRLSIALIILGSTVGLILVVNGYSEIYQYITNRNDGFPTKGNFSAFGYQWLCYGHANLTCMIANPPSDYLDGGLGGNTTNGYNCDVFGVHMWCHKQ